MTQTIVKKYNAEVHSQSVLECILEMKKHAEDLMTTEIGRIEIEFFDVAYNIIGGGEEGDKTVVQTKEQADHSLAYMVAVALLDDQVVSEQYRSERIAQTDVQTLLRKISVRPKEEYSRRFPGEMPCRFTVSLRNSQILVKEKKDYEGFHTCPARWETAVQKFAQLSEEHASESLRREIVEAVGGLETIAVTDLMELLARTSAN